MCKFCWADRNAAEAFEFLCRNTQRLFCAAGEGRSLTCSCEPFEILAGANRVIPVPAGPPAQRLAMLAAFTARRDDLGTTHHDAGTMRMGDAIADAVTNDFGRIHDTTNCYVAGPALFPTIGSPNPMLTGVALGRRTGDLLNRNVLPVSGRCLMVRQPLSASGGSPDLLVAAWRISTGKWLATAMRGYAYSITRPKCLKILP
jgi:hypothetical protein